MDYHGTAIVTILLHFSFSSVFGSYKVQVPSSPVMAVRGSCAVLSCSFPPLAQPELTSGLLVTWQRVEDSRVVHSFYYDQNQLSRQSVDFKNRTQIYVSELWKGNASVRITDVRAQDAGRYLCTVSDARGIDKAEVKVEYAAFYSEPRLIIEVGPHNTSIQFETEGFPKAEVQWLGPQEQVLEHQSNFTYGDGLFYLRTSYMVQEHAANTSLILRLTNQPLDQLIVRLVHFSQGQGTSGMRKDNDTIALGCTCVILGLLCASLLIYICRDHKKKNRKSAHEPGHNGPETSELNGGCANT